ncbi:MAG: hypothetical protein WB608_24015 [Terracidiphilus sp.]
MSFVPVEHVSDVLDGRAGFCLRGEWGHLAAVLGGGHICQLVKRSHPDLNPLWRPQWETIDPERFSPKSDECRFGGPPDGRLLAGIAGHSLSFDYFGPPSKEEMAAGLSTHGEAPAVRWQIFREFQEGRPGLEYGAELPVAQIDFRRTLRIDLAHPVVYCEEKARNLGCADRPISWTEHVTIGPPFLACEATLVDMPATQSRVNPASYSDAMMITPDAEFQWPLAPLQCGGFHDLRTTPDGCYLRYTAQLLDPSRAMGYTAIANPSAGLLLVYVFRRTDFLWVGNWEERFYLKTAPWGGKTFCRGIEFSSTPFAAPKRQTVSQGPLFNESTYRWLPALSEATVRYTTLLVDIPADFRGVEEVSVEAAEIVIRETGNRKIYSIPADGSFLTGDATGLR